MPTYILGRDQVVTAPGVVSNDDVVKAVMKAAGTKHDVSTFGAVNPVTQVLTMIGLVDLSFEITLTHTDALTDMSGTFVLGNVDGAVWTIDAVVLDVDMQLGVSGRKEWVVKYGVKPMPTPPGP